MNCVKKKSHEKINEFDKYNQVKRKKKKSRQLMCKYMNRV